MKIVIVDNFNRETIEDILIAENVDVNMGIYIVNTLNEKEYENSPRYFKLVEDDYVLWRGLEQLI